MHSLVFQMENGVEDGRTQLSLSQRCYFNPDPRQIMINSPGVYRIPHLELNKLFLS